MGSPRALGAELWQEIVERLDGGIVVFDQYGVAIYANAEAARLLSYRSGDVLGLDKEDFAALCYRDRLDGARFNTAFMAEQPIQSSTQSYEIATSDKRLRVRAFTLAPESEPVTILLLREIEHWYTGLIAQTMTEQMHSPLAFASSACQTLQIRLKEETAHPFELQDLARIIHDGVRRALTLSTNLEQLYLIQSRQIQDAPMGPVVVKDLIKAGWHDLELARGHGLPPLRLDLPGALPPVRASQEHLKAALTALFDGITARMPHDSRLAVMVSDQQYHLQIELIPDKPAGVLQPYLLDTMPFALAEQAVLQQGGRVWVETEGERRHGLNLTLPVWRDEHSSANI